MHILSPDFSKRISTFYYFFHTRFCNLSILLFIILSFVETNVHDCITRQKKINNTCLKKKSKLGHQNFQSTMSGAYNNQSDNIMKNSKILYWQLACKDKQKLFARVYSMQFYIGFLILFSHAAFDFCLALVYFLCITNFSF